MRAGGELIGKLLGVEKYFVADKHSLYIYLRGIVLFLGKTFFFEYKTQTTQLKLSYTWKSSPVKQENVQYKNCNHSYPKRLVAD